MTANALQLERRYDASCERVWDALLKPEITERAFLSAGMEACTVLRDVRVGGKWSITARTGGMEMTTSGVYLEVDAPRRVSYTFAMPAFSPNEDRLTAVLAPDGDGCRLTYMHEGPDIAAELAATPPGHVGGAERGWRQMLDQIADALAGGQA